MAQLESNVNQPNDQGGGGALPYISHDECPEAAKTELYIECEEQFAELQMLQDEIVLSEPDLCDDAQDQSVNRLIETEAELKLWLSMEPKLLATNPQVLLHAGKEELHRLCSELEMIVSCCQAKRVKLMETLKCEEKWLEEKKEVLCAATNHVEKLKMESEKLSYHSVLQDTKDKIQQMKQYHDRLIETLADILDEHFPLPQKETSASKKKKSIPQEFNENLISLNEILELLMNKALGTPHDPYVTIDETFWQPYIEILLRYDIAVRHPENNFKIRLENFC